MAAKGILARAAAASLLLYMAPLLLGIAFVIRADGGPALIRQPRINRNGRHFRSYQFRITDAEQQVTRFGTWLHRSYLDEIPQLLNVLRGETSLI